MNIFDSLSISSSGLKAQRVRMNLISSNLANMHTTRTPEGGPYQRKEAVFAATPVSSPFGDVLRAEMDGKISGVEVVDIVKDARPPLDKFDPNHPDADARGFVKVPDINLIEEMVNMLSATRSYEANVTAVTATKNMALKALEIGR
jgi:flagellar basal-body rod protein FlgC